MTARLQEASLTGIRPVKIQRAQWVVAARPQEASLTGIRPIEIQDTKSPCKRAF